MDHVGVLIRKRNMRLRLIIIISTLILVSCQQQNGLFTETITSIEVQEWDHQKQVMMITEEKIINDLTSKLENANSATTADIDIPSPDYRLLFMSNEKVVRELGYYIESKNYKGVHGRHIDFENGRHYRVKYELHLDHN